VERGKGKRGISSERREKRLGHNPRTRGRKRRIFGTKKEREGERFRGKQ